MDTLSHDCCYVGSCCENWRHMDAFLWAYVLIYLHACNMCVYSIREGCARCRVEQFYSEKMEEFQVELHYYLSRVRENSTKRTSHYGEFYLRRGTTILVRFDNSNNRYLRSVHFGGKKHHSATIWLGGARHYLLSRHGFEESLENERLQWSAPHKMLWDQDGSAQEVNRA
jgi:hypothetical protein